MELAAVAAQVGPAEVVGDDQHEIRRRLVRAGREGGPCEHGEERDEEGSSPMHVRIAPVRVDRRAPRGRGPRTSPPLYSRPGTGTSKRPAYRGVPSRPSERSLATIS